MLFLDIDQHARQLTVSVQFLKEGNETLRAWVPVHIHTTLSEQDG